MSPPSMLLRASRSAPRMTSRSTTFSRSISSSQLPRVMQPSLWQSLVPKALRNTPSTSSSQSKPAVRFPKTRAFFAYPTTPVLLLALLIGSQAIQLLRVKNEMLAYSRQADAKIALLREVIQRVQKGEDVDVEKILGTGDPQKEQEWWDVIKELESEEEYLKKSKAQAERRRLMKRGIRPESVAEGQDSTNKEVGAPSGDSVAANASSVETSDPKNGGKPVFF